MPFHGREHRRSPFDPHRIPARERLSHAHSHPPSSAHTHGGSGAGASTFRSLCIKGGWPHNAMDSEIIEAVERKFSKFPGHNIKIARVARQTIAYINFHHEDDAKGALDRMSTVFVFGRNLEVEPVIKGVLPVDPRDRERKGLRSRSRSPASPDLPSSARSRSRSPLPPRSIHQNQSPPRNAPRSAVVTKSAEPRVLMRNSDRNGGGGREVFFNNTTPAKAPRHNPESRPDSEPTSRMLHVTELDPNLTESDIYESFQAHASVMSIDMKYPKDGLAFATVGFLNPEESEKAMRGMQGKRIGRSACKLVYGASPLTKCVWVSNLNRKTTLGALEAEFERFGDIKKVDYSKGDNFAYIVFEAGDSARGAVKALNGKFVAGSDSRARFDYVDYDQVTAMSYHMRITKGASPPPVKAKPTVSGSTPQKGGSRGHAESNSASGSHNGVNKSKPEQDNNAHSRDSRAQNHKTGVGGGGGGDRSPARREDNRNPQGRHNADEKTPRHRVRSPHQSSSASRRRPHTSPGAKDTGAGGSSSKRHQTSANTGTPSGTGTGARTTSNEAAKRQRGGNENHRSPGESRHGHKRHRSPISSAPPPKKMSPADATDIHGLLGCLDSCWTGHLVLKNSAFHTNLLLLGGSKDICARLLCESSNGEQATALKITQRLRCETAKLEEVKRRMEGATEDGFCVLLAAQNSETSPTAAAVPEGTQPRQFKNLVSYLKSKHSAGVIGLPIGATDNQGVLHAFPPSAFFASHLTSVAPKITDSENLEDHLVIVILSGSG